MADDILKELLKLESLAGPSKPPAKGKSGSTPSLDQSLIELEGAFELARTRIEEGFWPEDVFNQLQEMMEAKRFLADKAVKDWYGALGKVGKALDKRFPPQLGAISQTYEKPSLLFSSPESSQAIEQLILSSMARSGAWASVDALQAEAGIACRDEIRSASLELHAVLGELAGGDVESALQWTSRHHLYLASSPHPSPLPFYLHRSRFITLLRSHPLDPSNSSGATPPALQYAQDHLFPFFPAHTAEIFRLLGALLFTPGAENLTPYSDIYTEDMEAKALVPLFRTEFCRLHGWPKEDPLEIVVELGANGALGKIEKARKVMEARLGSVQTWDELPMELPLPSSRQYHSVFACPVSKEQATEDNPPKMLTCGHVIAQDSLTKLSKHGRRAVKCPYCPVETGTTAALRLYF